MGRLDYPPRGGFLFPLRSSVVFWGLAGLGHRSLCPESRGRQRLIAAVGRVDAGLTFFFHVDDFTMRRDFAVTTGHTPAGESREPEEANETHHTDPPNADAQQLRRGFWHNHLGR